MHFNLLLKHPFHVHMNSMEIGFCSTYFAFLWYWFLSVYNLTALPLREPSFSQCSCHGRGSNGLCGKRRCRFSVVRWLLKESCTRNKLNRPCPPHTLPPPWLHWSAPGIQQCWQKRKPFCFNFFHNYFPLAQEKLYAFIFVIFFCLCFSLCMCGMDFFSHFLFCFGYKFLTIILLFYAIKKLNIKYNIFLFLLFCLIIKN